MKKLVSILLVMALLLSSCGEKTTTTSYKIMEGTKYENTVTVIKGKKDGPTIYMICGVHGDETAGWTAGNQLKEKEIQAGTIYILSPANTYGAENNKRRTEDGYDLNRCFPGDINKNGAYFISASIFNDVKDKQPDMVLDLHEGEQHTGTTDTLGNSIIFDDASMMGDLLLEMVDYFGERLNIFGTPPEGSVNKTITRELQIPVITVETLRTENLEERVNKQLEIVNFVLNFNKML